MRFWFNHSRIETDKAFPDRLGEAIHIGRVTGQIKGYNGGSNKEQSVFDASAITSCEIKRKDGCVLAVGYAICRGDQFNKKLGRRIAQARALAFLEAKGIVFALDDNNEPNEPTTKSQPNC